MHCLCSRTAKQAFGQVFLGNSGQHSREPSVTTGIQEIGASRRGGRPIQFQFRRKAASGAGSSRRTPRQFWSACGIPWTGDVKLDFLGLWAYYQQTNWAIFAEEHRSMTSIPPGHRSSETSQFLGCWYHHQQCESARALQQERLWGSASKCGEKRLNFASRCLQKVV